MHNALISSVLGLVLVLLAPVASAHPRPKDFFLDPPKKGLYAHADAFTAGLQLSLEHRAELDGDLTMLTTRASGLASLGFSEVALQSELRVAFLALGGTVGYRNTWRNYSAAPGDKFTIAQRREADAGKSFTAQDWAFAEARARLIIPMDSLWFIGTGTLRYEDSPANSFDWFHATMHDGGTLTKLEAVLFLRSKSLGAIGPAVRYMDMPRGGSRIGEFAFGFTGGTRVGLKKHSDMALLQVLAMPASDEFGFHFYNLPVWIMASYRMSFEVGDI